ncbi:MAG: hypothetical protein C5B51_29640 [Terriglobia bacterium]|nr:MAG: hypothetical protein C5B51_29640 [Terriglobia bacterium]
MSARARLFAFSLCLAFVSGAKADVVAILNLDATVVGQAAPYGANPVNIFLGPGTYFVTAVGIAGGGLYDAWSAFSSNTNCQPDHTCLYGWDASFDYSFSGGYFSLDNGIRWDSPAEALAHAPSATFTLTVGETVSFGINECLGCLADNRGGNSLAIDAVPEPTTMAGLTILFGVLFASRSRRKRADG